MLLTPTFICSNASASCASYPRIGALCRRPNARHSKPPPQTGTYQTFRRAYHLIQTSQKPSTTLLSGRSNFARNTRRHGHPAHVLTLTREWSSLREQVPVSGRWRYKSLLRAESPTEENEEEFLETHLKEVRGLILPPDDPDHIRVKRILDNILPFSNLDPKVWQNSARMVYVIDSPLRNARVMDVAGKITVLVYKGLLPMCINDDGLAIVLSHELSHIVAGHPAEQRTRAITTMAISFPFALWLALPVPLFVLATPMALFGMYRVLRSVLLFSRTCEHEADYISLVILSRAGYDLQDVVYFWEWTKEVVPDFVETGDFERIKTQLKEGRVPAWLSTHPTHQNRINHIKTSIVNITQKN